VKTNLCGSFFLGLALILAAATGARPAEAVGEAAAGLSPASCRTEAAGRLDAGDDEHAAAVRASPPANAITMRFN